MCKRVSVCLCGGNFVYEYLYLWLIYICGLVKLLVCTNNVYLCMIGHRKKLFKAHSRTSDH